MRLARRAFAFRVWPEPQRCVTLVLSSGAPHPAARRRDRRTPSCRRAPDSDTTGIGHRAPRSRDFSDKRTPTGPAQTCPVQRRRNSPRNADPMPWHGRVPISNKRAEHTQAPNVAAARPEPPVRSERFLMDGQHPENNNGLEPRRRKLEAD
jgi:hypothetical protein